MSFWEQQFVTISVRKGGGGYTGVLSSVSATFQHRYAALPAPHHPHTACDYLHPFEIIKTRESQIIVTDSWKASYNGLSALGSVVGERLKNPEIK